MDINTFINETLEDWARKRILNQIAEIRSKDIVASKRLIQSMEKEVIKATANNVATVLIAFETYGRYFDMRRINRRKQRPVDEIEDWIKDIGVAKFRTGFLKKNKLPLTEAKLINKIAWGIVKSKKKRKRKRWYNKQKEADINKLYDTLLTGFQDNTISQIKEAFK